MLHRHLSSGCLKLFPRVESVRVHDELKQLLVKRLIVHSKKRKQLLVNAARLLKSNPKDIVTKVGSLLSDMKELQRENDSLSAKLGNSQLADIMASAQQIEDVTVISARVDVKDNNGLRQMMDELKQKLSKGGHRTWCGSGRKSDACVRCDGRFKIRELSCGENRQSCSDAMRWKRRRPSRHGNGWCKRCI